MKNLGAMMQQAQKMQEKMTALQEELANSQVTGVSGGGMVEVTLSGRHETKSVKIDPALVNNDDIGVLEDLIVAACNDANGKVEQVKADKMSELTGGLNLPPGMKLPF